MSSRIEKDYVFDACIHFDGHFLINSYNIESSFLIETTNIIEHNTAIDRVGHFIYNCINHSIFVHETEVEAIQKYRDAGIKVIETPEAPNTGMLLSVAVFAKVNNIEIIETAYRKV